MKTHADTNILFVSQYFVPEVCAPAIRTADLAREWVRSGTAVTVLTGFPNHPEGVLHPEYRHQWRRGLSCEHYEGAKVIRTWLYPAANRGRYLRAANYLSFALSAAAAGSFLAAKDAVVIGSSPQVLVGLAAYLIAAARRARFVFDVRDLWPESLVAVGAASSHQTPAYRMLERLARFLYRKADRIAVDGQWKKRILVSYGVPEEKIAVIINGVAIEFFPDPASPAVDRNRAELRRELGLTGRFVALYCGTLGMAHGLETILVAADRLRDRPDIAFVLVGAGAERDRLVARISKLRLPNLVVLDKQPRSKVAACLAAADACVVPLRRSETFKTAIPSKMFEAMAAAKPVLLGVEGEARELLLNADAGLAFPPEDADGLIAGIKTLVENPQLALRLGRNGRKSVLEQYSRRRQALSYLNLVRELTESRRAARRQGCASDVRPAGTVF
jgi:glycosyltransferase involved in cell wall biosynthesis